MPIPVPPPILPACFSEPVIRLALVGDPHIHRSVAVAVGQMGFGHGRFRHIDTVHLLSSSQGLW